MRQLILLVGVELKEYLREPGIIFWSIFFPILLALGLGIAFSGGAKPDKTVAWVCHGIDCNYPFDLNADNTIKKLGNDKIGYTNYEFQSVTWEEALQMLKKGKVNLILERKGKEITYHFDPANADASFSFQQLSSAVEGNEIDARSIAILEQGGTRYIDFLVPGLLALGIMMSCMWGISYSNVDRRNKKLLRRMVATPMRKYNYVGSQLISRILLSVVESLLLIFITWWIFDIRITGSWFALALLVFAGNVVFAGLAILISSRTANTRIANGLINLVVMPMMIMSGIYFSYHNFPDFLIPIIQLLPLTILSDSIRAVFLEGEKLIDILPPAMGLMVFGLFLYGIGIRIYKWY